VGTRGAIGGVAVGIAIGIVYWLGAELLAAMGGVGQLPPLLAGWSPDIVFFSSASISSLKCQRDVTA